MIELFPIQDRDVSRKLKERATTLPGLVLVTGARQSKHSRPLLEREPFASLERRFGARVRLLVVVEEESGQVAWRDPLGDLAAHFFPEDRSQAYAASAGYLLIKDGNAEDVVKKQDSPEKDAWSIQEALAAISREIPRPGQATKRPSGSQSRGTGAPPGDEGERVPGYATKRPSGSRGAPPGGEGEWASAQATKRPSGPRSPARGTSLSESDRATDKRPRVEDANEPTPPWGARATGDWVAQPEPEEVTPVPVVQPDPWAMLGVAPGTPVAEVRKAFRALMTQYHPDKVAHLAPEFRELAERKSRQITEAWELIQSGAKGDPGAKGEPEGQ